MAEAARVNRISKERSEIHSQKLKAFFEKMPDPKEIIEQDQLMDVVPHLPEPATESVVSEPVSQLLYSTLHQLVNINLDVSINSSVKSSAVSVNINNGNRNIFSKY